MGTKSTLTFGPAVCGSGDRANFVYDQKKYDACSLILYQLGIFKKACHEHVVETCYLDTREVFKLKKKATLPEMHKYKV